MFTERQVAVKKNDLMEKYCGLIGGRGRRPSEARLVHGGPRKQARRVADDRIRAQSYHEKTEVREKFASGIERRG